VTAALNHSSIPEGSWDDLFDFLDPRRSAGTGPDRNREAEAKCLEITRKLVCFFAGRGCPEADDLAADTIVRVAVKCGTVTVARDEDRTGYFYGVARNVLHEWQRRVSHEASKHQALRREPSLLPVPDFQSWKEKEAADRCLRQCLEKLPPRARNLVLGYYAADKAEKIECHRKLAGQFRKTVNALRIEVHRIRTTLRECVTGCLHPRNVSAGSVIQG
jgi:RNA polymerase sigma factor (sigma-70 family)